MIAKILLDYLNEHLSVPAYMEAHSELTDYVLVDQTGSSRENQITTTTLAIQSYGDTLCGYEDYGDKGTAADSYLRRCYLGYRDLRGCVGSCASQ